MRGNTGETESMVITQGVPLTTEPGISLIILTPMKILQLNLNRSTFVVRNEEECVCSVCLFRFNIFIGVRIIKEMPGSVPSGTLCISQPSILSEIKTG